MIEIRDYYFDPAKLEEYKIWATGAALPFLKGKMEVVGFWVNNELSPSYSGPLKRATDKRQANVSWVIRWKDKTQRDQIWAELRGSPEWPAIMDLLPGRDESVQVEKARFVDEL
jgi:hypothetical protein